MKVCITIVLSLLNLFSSAQSPQVIEQKLLKVFRQIDNWAYNHEYSDNVNPSDSVQKYNDLFAAELLKYTAEFPATLDYSFKKLHDSGLIIVTSDDGMFRVYSWNTLMGGTMRIYSNVFQYKANNKVYAKASDPDNEPGYYYQKIHTLNTDSKKYYLGVNQAILGGSDFYQTVKVFAIEDATLNDSVKLIKTRSGLQNELGFEFNFFTIKDEKRTIDKLVVYDKVKKTLSIPVVLENLQVTKKMITYTFTGKYFEKIKH